MFLGIRGEVLPANADRSAGKRAGRSEGIQIHLESFQTASGNTLVIFLNTGKHAIPSSANTNDVRR